MNSSHKSHEAKLVKLGDKLYNLRDLQRSRPDDWPLERMQEYFVWARAVIAGIRGTNVALEKALDDAIAGTLTFEGKVYPCLPAEKEA